MVDLNYTSHIQIANIGSTTKPDDFPITNPEVNCLASPRSCFRNIVPEFHNLGEPTPTHPHTVVTFAHMYSLRQGLTFIISRIGWKKTTNIYKFDVVDLERLLIN